MGFHAQQAQPLVARTAILKPQARDLRPVAAAVIGLLLGSAALAQNAEGSTPATATTTTTLPEVTVSASGTNRTVDDMTTPVTVLQGDELVQKRGASLGETLANEPGIQATHFGAGASRPVIRGMDGARVKVLNDGAVIQDASTISPDHAVVSEPMLATQIEVLRGPSSVLYGQAEAGGLVSRTSKRPTGTRLREVEAAR